MTPGMKKPLVRRLLIPVVEIRISSGAMLVPTKGLDRLALIVLDAVNTVYLKQLVNTAYLESIATVFGADDIPVKVRCHRLTLCSYPLMREKCFGRCGVSHLAGLCECLSSRFQVVPKNTPHPKTFLL